MECWIYNEKTNKYICSFCNTETEYDYDFCPRCGYRHHATTTIDKYIEELEREYAETKNKEIRIITEIKNFKKMI